MLHGRAVVRAVAVAGLGFLGLAGLAGLLLRVGFRLLPLLIALGRLGFTGRAILARLLLLLVWQRVKGLGVLLGFRGARSCVIHPSERRPVGAMRLLAARRDGPVGRDDGDHAPAGLRVIRRRLFVVFGLGPIGDAVAGLEPQGRRLERIGLLELAGEGRFRRYFAQQRRDRQAAAVVFRTQQHPPQAEIGILGPDA